MVAASMRRITAIIPTPQNYIQVSRPASYVNVADSNASIDTGIKVSKIGKIELLISDWEVVKYNVPDSLPALFGGRYIKIRQETRSTVKGGNYPMVTNDVALLPSDEFTGVERIICDRESININGKEYTASDWNDYYFQQDDYNLLISASYFSVNGILETGFGNYKLYYFRIWDTSGNLLRDLEPAEKGGTGCLYDSVSKKYLLPTKVTWNFSGEVEIPVNVNLIDYDDVEKGLYINDKGQLVHHGPSCITGFIRINPAYTYEYKKNTGTWYCVAFFDLNKNLISVLPESSYGMGPFTLRPDQIPEGTCYIRMNGAIDGFEENAYFKRIA